MTSKGRFLSFVIFVLFHAFLVRQKLYFFADGVLFLANRISTLVPPFVLFHSLTTDPHTLHSLLHRRRDIWLTLVNQRWRYITSRARVELLLTLFYFEMWHYIRSWHPFLFIPPYWIFRIGWPLYSLVWWLMVAGDLMLFSRWLLGDFCFCRGLSELGLPALETFGKLLIISQQCTLFL